MEGEVAKTADPAAAARAGAEEQAGGITAKGLGSTPLAWRPEPPDFASLGSDPRLPFYPSGGDGGSGKGLAGGSEPSRPATEENAVGAQGTIGSGERCETEWRRRPAGLTDAPAAPRN